MALTQVANGTMTLSTSETTVGSSQTTAGVYVLLLDLSNLSGGDVVELTIYTKTLTGSTERLLDRVSFANTQGTPNFQTVPIVSRWQITYKLRQPTGTGRSVDYAIVTL
jgi:hypothetical protein